MKKVIKTVLCVCVLLIALLYATEEIEPGITWIKDSGKTVFVSKVIGARAAIDTINSAVYEIASIQQASEYHSIRIVLDSMHDEFSVAVDLHEGFDGVNWEFTTTLGTITLTGAREDTVLEVNLYPCPYFYLMFRETDAASTESLAIDTVQWFNPHK